MRVLHIITGLSTGGAERALFNLLSGGLAETGETAVLSLSDEGTFGAKIQMLGVPVFALNMTSSVPTPTVLRHLRQLTRDFRPDLIQGWMYHGNLAASTAAWFASEKPAVAWNVRHSLYSLGREKPLTRQVIRTNRLLSSQPEAILYNSNLSRAQHEAFGFYSRSGQVIANGFDMRALQPDQNKRRAIRKALGLDSQLLVVGHVARFHPMKDHAGFLKAAVQVLIRRDDVRILLVGKDININNTALSGIIPAEVLNRFHFIGEREDVNDVMQAMDCLCLSSAWGEGFPNVLAEAMCLGIPCVTTDVGDSRQLVGNSGFVVPLCDQDGLAHALLSLLSMTDEQRRAMGLKARERILSNYDLSGSVRKYLSLYRKICAHDN